MTGTVTCPVCNREVPESTINAHLDNDCSDAGPSSQTPKGTPFQRQISIAPIFNKSRKSSPPPSPLSARAAASQSSSAGKKRKAPLAGGGSTVKRAKATTVSRSTAPLAEKLRPQILDEFIGQSHLTGKDSLLISLLESGSTGSMVLWGPPGCGKTTLARLLAKRTDALFKELSATDSGIADIRSVVEEARGVMALTSRRTILFLDEVHRFNKAQQDIFLPFIEQGVIQLIGATTENPSFKLTSALLSRCRVFVLEQLTDENVREIVLQAIRRVSTMSASAQESVPSDIPGDHVEINHDVVSRPLTVNFPQCTPEILSLVVSLSNGDARAALSLLELVISAPKDVEPSNLMTSLKQSVSTSYDRTGDSRYDMISALHKSVRGSHGSAAMYWLARMLSTGEDPMYIARRMVVCASEDIGLADPHALPLAIAALQACQVIGMPECRINLAHLVAYLSEAPKSTRAYEAYKRAEDVAKQDPTLPVPLMVRNAPTKLMEDLGYSEGYCYNPNYRHPVTNQYLPEMLKGELFLYKAGDLSDKLWDEEALQKWEKEENGGQAWVGRKTSS